MTWRSGSGARSGFLDGGGDTGRSTLTLGWFFSRRLMRAATCRKRNREYGDDGGGTHDDALHNHLTVHLEYLPEQKERRTRRMGWDGMGGGG